MADNDKKYYCPICELMVKPTRTNNDNCSICGSKLNKGSYKRYCWQCKKEVTARAGNCCSCGSWVD